MSADSACREADGALGCVGIDLWAFRAAVVAAVASLEGTAGVRVAAGTRPPAGAEGPERTALGALAQPPSAEASNSHGRIQDRFARGRSTRCRGEVLFIR
jgi:hypothetical protein